MRCKNFNERSSIDCDWLLIYVNCQLKKNAERVREMDGETNDHINLRLLDAISLGNVSLVKQLLEQGADVWFRDEKVVNNKGLF
jgi:ankyrin repeat protein